MENAYGIGITNRYALFLDEEADPLDILKQSEKDQLAAKNKKIEAAATQPDGQVGLCDYTVICPRSLVHFYIPLQVRIYSNIMDFYRFD